LSFEAFCSHQPLIKSTLFNYALATRFYSNIDKKIIITQLKVDMDIELVDQHNGELSENKFAR